MEAIHCYRFEADIAAPIGLVFDCLNKDEHVLKWNTYIIEHIYDGSEDDIKEGSTYRSRQWVGKKEYEFEAKYSTYRPPHLVVIETETKEGISKTEYRLEETGAHTKFVVDVYLIPSNWFYKLSGKIFKNGLQTLYDEPFVRFVDYVNDLKHEVKSL